MYCHLSRCHPDAPGMILRSSMHATLTHSRCTLPQGPMPPWPVNISASAFTDPSAPPAMLLPQLAVTANVFYNSSGQVSEWRGASFLEISFSCSIGTPNVTISYATAANAGWCLL
jgi:hypothetical protein